MHGKPTGSHSRGQAPPPTYEEVTDPNGPPPTYDSLFGRLRNSESPRGFALNLHSAWLMCCSSVVVLVILGISTALPIAMIVIGTVYKHDCPKEPKIPYYLILAGSMSIVKNVIDIYFRARGSQTRPGEDPSGSRSKGTPGAISAIINIVLFATFIAGTVWVYRSLWPVSGPAEIPASHENGTGILVTSAAAAAIQEGSAKNLIPGKDGELNNDDLNNSIKYNNSTSMIPNPEYCDPTLFTFSLVMVSLGWALLSMLLFCCCGVLACMCVIVGLKGDTRGERRSWDDEQARAVRHSKDPNGGGGVGAAPSYNACSDSSDSPAANCQQPASSTSSTNIDNVEYGGSRESSSAAVAAGAAASQRPSTSQQQQSSLNQIAITQNESESTN